MQQPEKWQEAEILGLISDKTEENIALDFKRADSVQQTDARKSEISKDVSAFANSTGGVIIYGIEESPDPPHVAVSLSPIDPARTSKEWLEQVINSRIQPRIPGIQISPVELKTKHPGMLAYVVAIPESYTAHQASDKRYYRRYNFESVAMEDYEVRLVMNRASRPAYSVELVPSQIQQGNPIVFSFRAVVQNESEIVGHDVSVVLFVPRHLVNQPDEYQITHEDICYSRIVSTRLETPAALRSAVDAHPLFPYVFNFAGTVKFETNLGPDQRFTAFVNVYDQFGLALRSKFYVYVPSCRVKLKEESHAAKRILANTMDNTSWGDKVF